MSDKKSVKERKLQRREIEKNLKQYRKSEIVDMLCGVLDLPRDKILDVCNALTDLLIELSFTEAIVHFPKFGKFVFEPLSKRKIWNPKEKKSLVYQNPKMTFKPSHKLRSMLRKQYRRNSYQLAELNKISDTKHKQPTSWSKITEEKEG
jgi:nucleoid DNA-binding protein